MALRRVNPLLSKLLAIPIKERVKPHQKLIAARTLIDDAMHEFTACFFLLRTSSTDAKGGACSL